MTMLMQDWSHCQPDRGCLQAVQPFQNSSELSVRSNPERRDCFEVKGIAAFRILTLCAIVMSAGVKSGSSWAAAVTKP